MAAHFGPMGSPSNNRVIGIIDIGSSKTVCAVVAVSGSAGGARIIGVGQQRSRGIASGAVIDLPAAEASVVSAVARAERTAGVRLDNVVINVSCGRLKSHRFNAHVSLAGRPVENGHLTQLQSGAAEYAEQNQRKLVHWNRTDYRLDGQRGISNPIGLAGDRLTGCYHAVTADAGALLNLTAVLERAYLAAKATIPTPIASAYAVTREEERNLGVLTADFGGGTISYSGFLGGAPFACGVIPFGGHHVTYDIMQHFEIDAPEAERIKTLYGTLANAPSDDGRVLPIETPNAGGATGTPTRAELFAIVDHRVSRQLAVLAERIAPLRRKLGMHAPLLITGGASQFPAFASAVSHATGIESVRPAQPHPYPGLPETFAGPQFATLAGLTRFVSKIPALQTYPQQTHRYVDRLQRWVLETF